MLYNNSLYRSNTTLTQAFNETFRTLLSESTDVQGFIPNISGITLGDDSAIDQNLLTNFGEHFAISKKRPNNCYNSIILIMMTVVNPNVKIAVIEKQMADTQYSRN